MPAHRIRVLVRITLRMLTSVIVCWSIFHMMTNQDLHQALENFVQGRPKPDPKAQELEREVKAQPDNLALRQKILDYYLLRQFSDRWACQARREHIYWIIQHHPDSDLAATGFVDLDPLSDGSAYDKGKDLWLKQTLAHPTDTKILSNAAHYFTLHDRDIAQRFLKAAQTLEPNNPQYFDQLGHLYALGMDSPWGSPVQPAQEALGQYEMAAKLDSPEERADLLPEIAKIAFAAQSWDKARGYATEAIQVKPTKKFANTYGCCVHDGNVVLGRLALRDGDTEKAKQYLLAAGKTPGANTLDSFGPNMTLANDLLEKGERQTVLAYFDLCAVFWKNEKLNEWKEEVKIGRVPNFGANLFY